MKALAFPKPIRRVLVMGAHCDDIEIGCGGTLLRLFEANPSVEVRWVVFSSSSAREQEARRAAAAFLGGIPASTVDVLDFPNGYFPSVASDIKARMETFKPFEPDLVLSHYQFDLHQDHRTLAELTWNTFRDHAVWEYEIPKYDGDLGNPNLFVPLEPEHLEQKIEILLASFASQRDKHWFDPETFRALPRLRGVQSACRYAEAFYARKVTVSF